MNPLNKHVVFLAFFLKSIFSTVNQYERSRRPRGRGRRASRGGTSGSRGASRSQFAFLFTLLSSFRDRFQTSRGSGMGTGRNQGFFCFTDRHQSTSFRDDDWSESLDHAATAVHEILTSSSEADDDVDWMAEDQEMLRHINEMIREIRSREVGSSSQQR